MEDSIGLLDCHYRVIPGSGTSFTDRLDRIGREELGEACAQSLAGFHWGDPAVWIVRRVTVDLLFNAQAETDDRQIAAKWASRIVHSALRAVSKGADGQNVVRFADEADMLACFLADALRGEAGQRWYWSRFRHFDHHPAGVVALAVLKENQQHLARVLARLADLGWLDALWGVLDAEALAQLWRAELSGAGSPGGEAALAPFLSTAMRLVVRSSGPGWASAAQMQLWLHSYARSSAVAPDWRDRPALALAVASALEFLWAQGHLDGSIADIARAWKERNQGISNPQALSSLDWLDTNVLEEALDRLVVLEREGKERETALRPIFLAALQFVEGGKGGPPALNEQEFAEFARSSLIAQDSTSAAAPAEAQWVQRMTSALEFFRRRRYPSLSAAEAVALWSERAMQGAAALEARNAGPSTSLRSARDEHLLPSNQPGAEIEQGAPLLSRNHQPVPPIQMPQDNSFSGVGQEVWEQVLAQWVGAGAEPVELDAGIETVVRPNLTTPRRTRLIADLAKALMSEMPGLQQQRASIPSSSLKVYARLVATENAWSADPLALHTIDGLFTAAVWLARSGPPGWAQQGSETVVESGGWGPPAVASEGLRWRMLRALRPGTFSAAAGPSGSEALQQEAVSGQSRLASSGPVTERVLAAAELSSTGSRVTAEFLRTFGDAGLDLALELAASGVLAVAGQQEDPDGGIRCQCAGIFLLVRAMTDARLTMVAQQADYPLAPCIAGLGMLWGGAAAVFHGRLDMGVTALAGVDPDTALIQLQGQWLEVEPQRHHRFQANLLRMLAARGVLGEEPPVLHRMPLPGERSALIFGSAGSGGVWPLVRITRGFDEEEAALAAMREDWQQATQQDGTPAAAGEEAREALEQALAALGSGYLSDPVADWTLALAALSLLRLWAAWLGQFSSSSIPYLLRNFIRRPGRLVRGTDGLAVEMAHLPLDVVLSMAGYLAPFDARTHPWGYRIRFSVQESS